MYLDSIQIQNFQSIHNLSLKFGAEPTVLVGETNVGKSALIRAIRTVLSIPRGNSFITDKASSCSITLNLIGADGLYSIAYEKRRGGGTKLALTTPNRSHEWQAVTNLPDEVKALGLSGLVLDDTTTVSVNIASQLDDVFLLKSSQAVTAAKVLARISTVDRIHQGLKAVATDTTRLKTEQSSVVKSLASVELQLKKYSRVPELVDIFSDVSEIRVAAESLSQKLEQMNVLRLNSAIRIWSVVEKLDPSSEMGELTSIRDKVVSVVEKTALMKKGVLKIDSFKRGSEKLKALELPVSTEEISQAVALLKEVQKRKAIMAQLIQEVHMHLALGIEAKEELLRATKKEMEEKFPACPTCNRPWDHTHV